MVFFLMLAGMQQYCPQAVLIVMTGLSFIMGHDRPVHAMPPDGASVTMDAAPIRDRQIAA